MARLYAALPPVRCKLLVPIREALQKRLKSVSNVSSVFPGDHGGFRE